MGHEGPKDEWVDETPQLIYERNIDNESKRHGSNSAVFGFLAWIAFIVLYTITGLVYRIFFGNPGEPAFKWFVAAAEIINLLVVGLVCASIIAGIQNLTAEGKTGRTGAIVGISASAVLLVIVSLRVWVQYLRPFF